MRQPCGGSVSGLAYFVVWCHAYAAHLLAGRLRPDLAAFFSLRCREQAALLCKMGCLSARLRSSCPVVVLLALPSSQALLQILLPTLPSSQARLPLVAAPSAHPKHAQIPVGAPI